MNKTIKVFLAVVGVVIVAGILLFANALWGNPVSKMIAKQSAKKYVEKQYQESDFIIEGVYYNLKDGYYHAMIKSPSSIDSHFALAFNGSKLVHNSYEDDVLSGWNTYERIDAEYGNLVKDVFSAPNFPLESHIDFGTIELFEKNIPDSQPDVANYGVKLMELELDKQYDVKELAKTTGHIIYYAQDDEISFSKASELLMVLKNSLDDADIPFYAINFVLEKPRTKDGVSQQEEPSIHTAHFLYRDIYEEGLAERIEKSHTALMEYYEEQDAKMKEEVGRVL